MCGICGELRFDGAQASMASVEKMTRALERRGPDASGILARGRVALGHRRLSIIDLSRNAEQPMVDSELGLSIVYNGAIYNYRELRQELASKGYRFFSSGDTEVLLKAYHAWGRDFVGRLHGMFAFAIFERDSGTVLFARDRLGIKPLYFSETGKCLRFASSLPALLEAGGVDTSIDPPALHQYLSLHAIVPPPRTILRGVKKLPPATTLLVRSDGSRDQKQYWSLSFDDPAPKLSFEEQQERVLAALRCAVERRLVADVPVGVLLSGGLDSSLLVGLIAEAGKSDLRTFSIGFESVAEERGDEFQYSDLIAKHFATLHERIFISAHLALDSLSGCIRAMSEPMVSHDALGFYLLSESVSRYVKVVQSGQGADEVFAGYHWYPPMLTSRDPVADYTRVFFDRDQAEMRELVSNDVFEQMGNASLEYVRGHFALSGAQRAIDKTLRIDSTVMLVDDPVKRVDNMTMAFGLEARVPFLDHELVELAASIPAEMKVAQGGKHVLKEAARKVVPAGVIDRPKGYFPVPALKYLRGSYLDLVRDALRSRRARERGLFSNSYVDKLLIDPEAHITPLRGSKLWQLGLLELWCAARGI